MAFWTITRGDLKMSVEKDRIVVKSREKVDRVATAVSVGEAGSGGGGGASGIA